MKILLPVDGSQPSLRAVEHVIENRGWYTDTPELHLLNIQHPMPYGHRVSSVIGHDKIDEYHREEGMAALKPAMAKLDAAGLKYQYHIGVGDAAETIVDYARQKACDRIYMGTRGMGSVSNLLLGSVATKVIALSHVPVLLVK
jgi:Universal stress protein UspA and related nucleotide-binding proteins